MLPWSIIGSARQSCKYTGRNTIFHSESTKYPTRSRVQLMQVGVSTAITAATIWTFLSGKNVYSPEPDGGLTLHYSTMQPSAQKDTRRLCTAVVLPLRQCFSTLHITVDIPHGGYSNLAGGKKMWYPEPNRTSISHEEEASVRNIVVTEVTPCMRRVESACRNTINVTVSVLSYDEHTTGIFHKIFDAPDGGMTPWKKMFKNTYMYAWATVTCTTSYMVHFDNDIVLYPIGSVFKHYPFVVSSIALIFDDIENILFVEVPKCEQWLLSRYVCTVHPSCLIAARRKVWEQLGGMHTVSFLLCFSDANMGTKEAAQYWSTISVTFGTARTICTIWITKSKVPSSKADHLYTHLFPQGLLCNENHHIEVPLRKVFAYHPCTYASPRRSSATPAEHIGTTVSLRAFVVHMQRFHAHLPLVDYWDHVERVFEKSMERQHLAGTLNLGSSLCYWSPLNNWAPTQPSTPSAQMAWPLLAYTSAQ